MINGILIVNKEVGFTSHDVVAKLRGIVGQKKIGHTGTLDPNATGVLPICLGKATKVVDILTDKDKVYQTTMLLGETSDTQDASGTRLTKHDTKHITETMVRAVIQSFIGPYEQVPPMYSAIKIGGKKLYELARQGQVVERKPRPVIIHDLEIIAIELPRLTLRVHCSKGTYIRTLCADIGAKLGVGALMETLQRTQVGVFQLSQAKTLDEIEAMKQAGRLNEIIQPIPSLFPDLPKLELTPEAETYAYNGNPIAVKMLSQNNFANGAEALIYNQKGVFIGIYSYQADQRSFALRKFFLDPSELSVGENER